MLAGAREFFNSKNGRNVAIGVALLGLVVAIYSIVRNLGSDAINASRDRVLIDAKTGEEFGYTLQIGDKFPVEAPSGENTGYPAEQCYWTKDGKTKQEPTYVLLNKYKSQSEPTFCPDCGRLVIGSNPGPMPGEPPPPTQDDWKKRQQTTQK